MEARFTGKGGVYMLKKQDRQGVRTAADLERKYDFGEIVKIAENAKKTADEALRVANSASAALESILLALQSAQSTSDTTSV